MQMRSCDRTSLRSKLNDSKERANIHYLWKIFETDILTWQHSVCCSDQPLILYSPSVVFPSPSPAEAWCPQSCPPSPCWGQGPWLGPWCSASEARRCRESTHSSLPAQGSYQLSAKCIIYFDFDKYKYWGTSCFSYSIETLICNYFYLHTHFYIDFSGWLSPWGRR